MTQIKALAIFVLFFIYSNLLAQRFDDVVMKTHQITDQIYMLEGAGGNIGIFTGKDGVLMIDGQFSELSLKIKEAINTISDHPIKYLVNTHWHGDHTGGNANFAKDGTTIIAQHRVRKRLTMDQIRPYAGTTPAADSLAWPTISFGEDLEIHINDESVQLLHVHNAHTDGDSFVFFPLSNVLHMGDCFFRDRFPYIDLDMGGTVDGAIAAIEAAMMIIDEDTVIIPGHGSLANKEDLRRYLAMINTINDRVKNVTDDATKLEDLDVESLTEGYKDWGGGFINGEKWIRTLFTDFTRNQSK